MKQIVYLDYDVPIWRLFYNPKLMNNIPYEFIYDGKKYTNGITIIQFAWNIEESWLKNGIYNFNCPNPIICVPSQKLYDLVKKYYPKLNIVLAGHNAFINENTFKIINIEKKYDLIVNSCWADYKRLELTKKVENKIYIGYSQDDVQAHRNIPKDGYMPNFENKERVMKNHKWIGKNKLVEYYNQSIAGGVFSKVEGSTFSSGEYLLCGIPVISTKCEGGREHWYNKHNSVICEDNKDDVVKSIEIVKNKIKNKEFNSEKIRNDHIAEMNIQRSNLTNKVIEIFTKITLNVPKYNKLFDDLKYYHSNSDTTCLEKNIEIKQINRQKICNEILKL